MGLVPGLSPVLRECTVRGVAAGCRPRRTPVLLMARVPCGPSGPEVGDPEGGTGGLWAWPNLPATPGAGGAAAELAPLAHGRGAAGGAPEREPLDLGPAQQWSHHREAAAVQGPRQQRGQPGPLSGDLCGRQPPWVGPELLVMAAEPHQSWTLSPEGTSQPFRLMPEAGVAQGGGLWGGVSLPSLLCALGQGRGGEPWGVAEGSCLMNTCVSPCL